MYQFTARTTQRGPIGAVAKVIDETGLEYSRQGVGSGQKFQVTGPDRDQLNKLRHTVSGIGGVTVSNVSVKYAR